jgi:hypothetical protein
MSSERFFSLDVLNELGIQVGKSVEFSLVQIHHEELVGWGQVRLFRGELTVKV